MSLTRRSKLRITAALILFAALTVWAFTVPRDQPALQAYATGVYDGDTIYVVWDRPLGLPTAIRLYLIDAPEIGEPYSFQAKDRLKALVLHKTVYVTHSNRLSKGRLLAFITLAEDAEPIQLTLLREGLAGILMIHPEETEYVGRVQSATQAAQVRNLGIWR